VTSTISVALCTYNGERFIAQQLRSILEQTRPADELVVSDDGSSDGTLRIVDEVFAAARADGTEKARGTVSIPRLTLLKNPAPLGVVRNFEQAMGAATGDLIALCDQDDRWAPDKLERFERAFADDPGLLLLNSDARLVNDAGEPLGYTLFNAIALTPAERALVRKGDGFAALLGRNFVTGATTVFRRKLLQQAVPFPESWVHDEWLAILAASFGRFDFLDAQLIDYRQHGGNAIGALRITFSDKIARLREPRAERNGRLLDRAEALEERLRQSGADQRLLDAARAKLAHERVRSGLPAVRIARLSAVLREYGKHGYSRYGRGAQDALRDLVQPAN